MMPWKLYADAAAYIFTWLLGYSSLMGALGGILIADYWILRRQRLVARRPVPGAGRVHLPRRRQPAGGRGARDRGPAGGARVRARGDDARAARWRTRTSSTGSTRTPGSSRSG